MVFKNEETNIQVAVANYLRIKYPSVLFTIAPNGIKLPIWTAKMLKMMGYRAGTPDVLIFEPRKEYNGLFIELKTEKGKLSDLQNDFLIALESRGYKASVCFGYNKAIEAINKYFLENE
jgi:hypothetical protein